MSIVIAPATDRLAWDAYIDSNPLAGPYHRHAWLEAVSRAYGFGVAPLAAVRDSRIVGILPMVRFSLPARAGRWISLPYCDYGGPLATEETVRARLLEYAMALAREKGDALVTLRSRSEGGQAGGKVLMRLALPQGSEPLLRTFPAKLRSQILKPARDGLTAVSGGEELLPAFYSVFARNMRDLGSPTHSLAWFQAVARGFGPQCRVWLVRLPDGQPAAAGMTLCQGRQTCLPWASSVRQYNRTNANMLLYWAMLGKAADEGQVVFDFGRSTPGSGTYRFKAQWGARESGLEWATCDAATGLMRSGTSPSSPNGLRTLAASCWRRLPLAVANLVGPRLRRHISL